MFSLVVSKARTVVSPRTFTDELLPGRMMLYVQDVEPDTGVWKNLLIHDVRDAAQPKLILARTGELVIDRGLGSVRLQLGAGTQHTLLARQAARVRPPGVRRDELRPPGRRVLPGAQEAAAPEGRPGDDPARAAARGPQRRAQGKNRKDWGRFAVEWHKKFAIPSACLVFGVLGLALSLGSKKEARSAAFALSIAVIFVYYVLHPARRAGGRHGADGALARRCGAPTSRSGRWRSRCCG